MTSKLGVSMYNEIGRYKRHRYNHKQQDMLNLGLTDENISNISNIRTVVDDTMDINIKFKKLELSNLSPQCLDLMYNMISARIKEIDSMIYEDKIKTEYDDYLTQLADERYCLKYKLSIIQDASIRRRRKSMGIAGTSKAINGGGVYSSGKFETTHGSIDLNSLKGVSL